MTRTRDVAFVRRLCALGLPPQTLAPALLPPLRALVGAHSSGVFWVDARDEISGLYAERLLPPEALAAYYERHYRQGAARFAEAFARRAADPDPLSFASFSGAERESAYFRDVMRPLGAWHVLYAMLGDGTRKAAQVSFYRGERDRPFGSADASVIRPLLRYLEAGLVRPARETSMPDAASVAVEEELGVVDASGRWVSAPEPWVRLLRMAASTSVSPREASSERERLLAFARAHCKSASDAEGVARAQASFLSPWGRFTVRTFRLPDAAGQRDDHFGLLLRREEPRSLSLVRGAGLSDLSAQQREVAVLLAQGLTNPQIAASLGLSPNTASYHVKQVYARLGVSDRHEVGVRLLHLAQGSAGDRAIAGPRAGT